MRGVINDFQRRLIGLGLRLLGLALTYVHEFKIKTYYLNQKWLRLRYRIRKVTPILNFGPEAETLINRVAARSGKAIRFATTSGSTAKPKRILFTRKRLRAAKIAYVDMFARLCWSQRIQRTSLYVFSSFENDDSLTSLLLEERRLPKYFSTLQAPYRLQYHPVLRSLVSQYGTTAVRLWFLTIANPGILYSTNPSTLANFLEQVAIDWSRSSRLIRDWYKQPESFPRHLGWIFRRIDSVGSRSRLKQVAESDSSLPLEICAPRIHTYICWTGGYVQPFLERIANYLPETRYRLVPMYSMSTETIETISHFKSNTFAFLPLARGVVYEFLKEHDEDRPDKLCRPEQLQPGKKYSMVVSDSYGLRRYQSKDLFLCRRYVKQVPDLVFVGRQGLEYSFTGEKLTDKHVSEGFQRLREQFNWLEANQFLTCVPCSANQCKPHYTLVHVEALESLEKSLCDLFTRRFDELLCEINCEYGTKRASGRLAPIRYMWVTPEDFAKNMSQNNSMDGQFKFLPFYKRKWECNRKTSETPTLFPDLTNAARYEPRSGSVPQPNAAALRGYVG
jgi:hypothetical protein